MEGFLGGGSAAPFHGDWGAVVASIIAHPPVTGFGTLLRGREPVLVEDGTQLAGRLFREGVVVKQRQNRRLSLQHAQQEIRKPRVVS